MEVIAISDRLPDDPGCNGTMLRLILPRSATAPPIARSMITTPCRMKRAPVRVPLIGGRGLAIYASSIGGVFEMEPSYLDRLQLDGLVAVVTGAARGIGRAAAVALAAAGADIVGIDIAGPVSPTLEVKVATSEDLAATGAAVEALGRRFLAMTADQRDLAALRRCADDAVAQFGGIDILFANAGIQAFKPLLEMDDADWHDQIDVNLTGTANAIRAFGPAIVAHTSGHSRGRIIVSSSTQGRHGTKFGAAYSASKWGIIGLMKSAALELGTHGITVNAVIPGLIDTPLTRHESRYAQALQEGGKTPEGEEHHDEAGARKALTAKTPLGVPWIEPQDVAPLIAFLASDAARMISGATFDVTGGDSAHYQ